MNWIVLLVGVAVGLSVAFGRVYVESLYARERGLPPGALFRHRDVLTPFLVLAGAANIYALWIVVTHGSMFKTSTVLGLFMLVAAQVLQLHIAIRPRVRDLELALASCAPYVYMFTLYVIALATNSHTLWLF